MNKHFHATLEIENVVHPRRWKLLSRCRESELGKVQVMEQSLAGYQSRVD